MKLFCFKIKVDCNYPFHQLNYQREKNFTLVKKYYLTTSRPAKKNNNQNREIILSLLTVRVLSFHSSRFFFRCNQNSQIP